MRVILSGGGTGGHIYPAIAIGTLLKKKFPEVQLLYVGTKNGLEASIVPKEGIDFETVTVEGLPRKPSIQGLKTLGKLVKGFYESQKIINSFKPDLVIATGGYVCGPISYLASLKGVKLVLHEQNALPGITNRILASRADLICVTFEESKSYFKKGKKVEVTGLPIRPQILGISRDEAAKNMGIDPSKFIILVTGGSRGAKKLNDSMLKVMEKFSNKKDIHIIHITGDSGYLDFKKQFENLAPKNVTVKPYLHNMQDALGCADLVVGRAGATFISEIAAVGIPAILVPYPYASENHQEANALSLVKKGAAIMLKDKELSGEILFSTINDLYENREKLKEMQRNCKKIGKPDAGERIVSLIEKLF